MKYRSFAVLALLAFAMDQMTKAQARYVLGAGDIVELVEGRIWAMLAFNPYGALSMGKDLASASELRPLLIAAMFAGIGFMLALLQRPEFRSPTARSGLALMCGGGFGNLWDQVFDARGVTDFLVVGRGFPQGGVFNFADIWIVCGAMLVLASVTAYNWRRYRTSLRARAGARAVSGLYLPQSAD